MNKFQALLFLLFTSCFVQAQDSYSIQDIPSDLKENANSVLINETIEVDVTSPGKLKYKEVSARAILNKRGNSHGIAYTYYDKGETIKQADVYIYDAFGNKLEHYRKRDFHDVSAADGFSIYNDSRILYLEYTPTTYPYIIVFTKEYENNTTAGIPSWKPVDGYTKSTKKSSYTLTYDPANKPRILTQNLEGLPVSVTETENSIICKADNLMAVKYESLSKPFKEIAPSVSFTLNNFTLKGVSGTAKNWEEYGKWMQHSLLSDVSDLPESTIATIRNLVKDETTNEGKARVVYNYVQEKVRYVSIQIGIGGWKPMLASEVDKLSYGDCKALTNYTKALLDAVGVPSYYTVLYSDEDKVNFNENFSRLQGNHVILGIPNENGDITWLECTSQDTPFGYIGRNNDDRNVLIITPEGGKIAHTKKYEFHENQEITKAQVYVNRKGGAKVHYSSVSSGLQYGDKYWLTTEKEEDVNKYYKSKWENISSYTIDSLNLINNKKEIVFEENVYLDIPSYTIQVGTDLLINVNVFNQNTYIPTRITDRKQELHIARGYEDKNTIELNLPEGYKIGELPEDQLLETAYGTYQVSYTLLDKNKLEYKRHIIIKKGTYPKEAYNDYRSFRKKIAKLDKTKLIVTK